MLTAIEQAKKGLGFVSPNPPVGCVIVSANGEIIGLGYHKKIGDAHAEVNALSQVKDKSLLKNATVYVTLEPCAHEGRTPSCAKNLAKLPIAEVVYGIIDPNPKVSGQGIKILESAGIKTRKMVGLEVELNALAEHFLINQIMSTAFLTLKVAISLDGQIGLKNGDSKWITSEESRKFSRKLRAHHDAVMVGAGTLLKDDPLLDLRDTEYSSKKQSLVIYDPKDRISTDQKNLKVFKSFDPDKIVFIKPIGAKESFNNIVFSDDFSFDKIKKNLYGRSIFSIYAEGGSYLHSMLLQQRAFDRLIIFIAPKIIGALNGKAWTSELGIDSLNQAIELRELKTDSIMGDIVLTGSKSDRII